MKEKDGTTTSSPGPTPSRCSARCSAVVQLDTATASVVPSRRAKSSSKARTRGPWATQPEVTASAAAAASSSPIHGRITGIVGSPVTGCVTVVIGRLPRRAVGSRGAAGGWRLLGLPPLDQSPQPVVQADLRLPAEPGAGRGDVGKASVDGVAVAGLSVHRDEVGVHRPQQLPGQVEQAGLLAGGDVEKLVPPRLPPPPPRPPPRGA